MSVPRRGILLAAAGGLVLGGGIAEGADALAGSPEPEKRVSPGEDLMREHGVLKRILLCYRECSRRLEGGEDVAATAIRDAAVIVRDFIEGFHEGLEEAYVFPALQQAGRDVDTVRTLLVQHGRGRRLTARLIADATAHGLLEAGTRRTLSSTMDSFVRMYEPHEAREDTVVFPAFYDLTPGKKLNELSERFAEEQDRQFGANGFARMLNRVVEIERELGIDDLNKFTPAEV